MTTEELTRRTVRELAGEIWWEPRRGVPEADASWQVKNDIVDIVMGVLARRDQRLRAARRRAGKAGGGKILPVSDRRPTQPPRMPRRSQLHDAGDEGVDRVRR